VSVRAFVAIGSNVGDRRAHCEEAATRLGQLPETVLIGLSPLVETPAAEGVEGGPFLNGVAELDTALSPLELLRSLQVIETALGRPRDHQPGMARTMDLDILLYGERIVRHDGLEIPHPRMAERRFVLEPLVALAPAARHPVLNETALNLLRRLGAVQPSQPPSGP
jgi:2-amino-4-hydroxy-6-hydroxymethyldihydropteridine diphosphokinase